MTHVRVWTDALTYAVVVTVLAIVLALVLGIATGGGAVRGKQLLFVFGWIAMAYATVQLWPSSPEDLEQQTEPDVLGESLAKSQERTSFQAYVRSLPPNRWIQSPGPTHRISTGGKLFLASILMLVGSFLMETIFGVT